jgi:renal tumor antigen
MDQYRLEIKKGEGTFSEVFMAQCLRTGKYVAIKCMKKKYETIEKVRKLKEIQALNLLMPHEHIIKLIEVLYDEPSGR